MDADEVVRRMHHEACRRRPSIVVPLETFQRHCRRISGGEAPSAEMRTCAADIYLCCACAEGDKTALRVLEREADAVVRGAVQRVHRDPEFVAETLQEFWKKLLVGPDAKVLDYRGRGPLQAWLRVAAARLAIDRRRAERAVAGRETDLGECLAEQDFGPESILTQARFRAAFRQALQHATRGLSEKERNLLRMHIVGRCSIDQIGRAYNVHRATAARWLEQARERIWQTVRHELEMVGPPLTDSEFQSVARVMGGELDFEISALPADVLSQRSSSTR